MKKAAPKGHAEALIAARKSAIIPALVGLAAAGIQLALEPAFVALHCLVLSLGAAYVGSLAARAATLHRPQSAILAGSTAGSIAGLAYGVPFATVAGIQWLRFDAAELARRVAAMTDQELAYARGAGFDPTSLAFHTNQEVSYIFAYLIFGFGFGWLFGAIGAAMARRGRTTA